MKLTHKQKKFIKKNRYKLSQAELAAKLGVTTADIAPYVPHGQGEAGKHAENTSGDVVGSLQENLSRFVLKQWWDDYWGYVCLVVCLVIGVYLNGLNSAFVSDDIAGILNNPAMADFSLLIKSPGSILRQLVYFAVYQLAGPTPIFFRIPNVLFHAGSSVLVLLLGSWFFNKRTAVMAACLFAVHPLLAESVIWISGGNYSQSTLFLLISFALYLLAGRRDRTYLAFSVIAFVAAILSSEKAMVFPAILVLGEALRRNLRGSWKHLVPFFVMGGAWALLYVSRIGSRLTSNVVDHYGPAGDTFYNPLVQVPVALTTYLRLYVWPVGLSLYHSDLSTTKLQFALLCGVLLALVGLYIWSLFKKPIIFFWASWFWISLLPTLTPLKVAWVVAERYVYFGSVGLCMIAAWLIHLATRRWQRYYVDWLVLALLVSFLGTLTVMRNVEWWNEDNLWFATARTSMNFPQTHNNLGDVYSRRKEYDKAIAEFTLATQLNPNYADAYHNLASAYYLAGNLEQARNNYDKALSINPNLWQGYQAKAMLEFNDKKYELAAEYMRKAVALAPLSSEAQYNLGVIYVELGQLLPAREAFNTALQLVPHNQLAKQALQIVDTKLNAGVGSVGAPLLPAASPTQPTAATTSGQIP